MTALRVFLAVGAAFVAAGSAHAAPILPNALSYEYFGLNFASNIQTSDTVGTLDYTGQPGCGGICTATTQLGSSPSVSATVNEVVYQFTGGGVVQASLAYYVEYLNAPGTYTINLHAIGSLSAPDGASESAHLIFGPAGPSTTSFNNFTSVTFEEADCLNGCPAPGFGIPTAPFAPDNQVQMDANVPYLVRMDLLFRPTTSGLQISGLIDPTFTTTSGGEFIFSPGVFAAPEPGTSSLLLAGVLALGTSARYRRH